MPFAATWIDLERILLSEISQTEKDKYCMIFIHTFRVHIYMWNLKEYNKLVNITKEADSQIQRTN